MRTGNIIVTVSFTDLQIGPKAQHACSCFDSREVPFGTGDVARVSTGALTHASFVTPLP